MALLTPAAGPAIKLLRPKTHCPLRADVLGQCAVNFPFAAPETYLRLLENINGFTNLLWLFNIIWSYFFLGDRGFLRHFW